MSKYNKTQESVNKGDGHSLFCDESLDEKLDNSYKSPAHPSFELINPFSLAWPGTLYGPLSREIREVVEATGLGKSLVNPHSNLGICSYY